MQWCLGGKVHNSLLIYLDDLLVHSPDFDTHINHLEQVFEKLAVQGISTDPQKTVDVEN